MLLRNLLSLLQCALAIQATMAGGGRGLRQGERLEDVDTKDNDEDSAMASLKTLQDGKSVGYNHTKRGMIHSLRTVQGNNSTSVAPARRDVVDEDVSDLFVFPQRYNTKRNCKRKAQRLQKRYDRKVKQWELFNPSCYTYTYQQVCYRCPPPVEVTVVDGVVQSTVPTTDVDAPTMEDLFSTLSGYMYDCSQGYIHQLRVKFGRRGVITALDMDETNELWDDEHAIYIRNFQTC